MADPIKRGDAATLQWVLDPMPTGATSARVVIRPAQPSTAAPVVNRAGTIEGNRVSIVLTPAETAIAGIYRCEVEISPGPLTFPSDGYDSLRIVSDLG